MDFTPYLHFNGQCAAAFAFYAECLGGRIVTMQTHGDSPMKDNVPADWQDKIMHARLEVGSRAIMGTDAPPAYYAKPQGFSVSVSVASAAEGERLFTALAEGGTISMPYQQTFWSPGFGMLVDRFGMPWMINCEPAA